MCIPICFSETGLAEYGRLKGDFAIRFCACHVSEGHDCQYLQQTWCLLMIH